MNFDFTQEQKMIAATAKDIARQFGPEYWREKEEKQEFAGEFWKAISESGFTGIVIPEKYGGAGKGITELLIAMEELVAHGCGLGGAWYLILSEILGAVSIIKHGTETQKKKYLPGIGRGELKCCMALTEPDAGSNTLNIKTTAQRKGNKWLVNGSKTWISGPDLASVMLLIARTTPKDKVTKKSLGLSLFLVDLPNPAVDITPIAKHGINYSHSCQVGFNELELAEEALMPPQDRGWYSLLDTLNTERMSFTAACIGLARLAMNKAIEYAKQRKVFGEVLIGQYQALQVPLSEAYASLEAAKLMNFKASTLWENQADPGEIGAASNIAKVIAVENALKAIYWSMQVFGGYGYAKEYDVERWWREINLIRLAPVTQQMALNYIGEHVLGMPRSY